MIFAIIAAVVGLFIWGRLPVMLVALMVPLALFFTGILPLDQVFSGFGDTVIIFIASLFVVAAGLEASGVTAWVGQWLSRAVGSSPLKLSLFTLLIVALLSPLISQSGAVAALVPVVVLHGAAHGQIAIEIPHAAGLRLRRRIEAGAHRHGQERADLRRGRRCRLRPFRLLRIRLGRRAAASGHRAGRRHCWAAGCCRSASPANLPEDFGQHARTLTEQYAVSGSARLYRLRDGSPLLGKSREALESDPDVSLIAVSGVAPDKAESKTFAAGDVLVLRGSPEALARFAEANRLDADAGRRRLGCGHAVQQPLGPCRSGGQAALETRGHGDVARHPHRERAVRGGGDPAQRRGPWRRGHGKTPPVRRA